MSARHGRCCCVGLGLIEVGSCCSDGSIESCGTCCSASLSCDDITGPLADCPPLGASCRILGAVGTQVVANFAETALGYGLRAETVRACPSSPQRRHGLAGYGQPASYWHSLSV